MRPGNLHSLAYTGGFTCAIYVTRFLGVIKSACYWNIEEFCDKNYISNNQKYKIDKTWKDLSSSVSFSSLDFLTLLFYPTKKVKTEQAC